jgi:hypothetical protein
MQFTCKLNNNLNLSINYNNNQISNTQSIKFLGLMLDTNLTWRNHISITVTLTTYILNWVQQVMPLEC